MNVGMDQPKTWSCEDHPEPWAIKSAEEDLFTGKPDFGMSFGEAAEGFLGMEDTKVLCLPRGYAAGVPQAGTGG